MNTAFNFSKLSLSKAFKWSSLLILILNLSACDLVSDLQGGKTAEETFSVNKKTTENKTTQLGSRTLVIMHNIVSDNINIRVDGEYNRTDTEIVFEKVGLGSTDANAQKRLDGIRITEETNAGAQIYRIDAAAPTGTFVNAVIKMPRENAVRLQLMSGKVGVYDIDGNVDITAWRGWVDVLTGGANVRVNIEEGDTNVKMYRCKQENILDVSVLKGSAVLTIPRTINPPAPQSAALNATTKTGTIKVVDLDVINRQQTATGYSGLIDRSAGVIKAYVGSGDLTIESWSRLNGG